MRRCVDVSCLSDEATARARATGRFADVVGHVADARELPFASASFDVVTSTYALYHVPQPEIAVGQIARVVTDDGTVGIMTNGPDHLAEIADLRVEMFGPSAAYGVNDTFSPAFAAGLLVDAFDDVLWSRYDDELRVTDVDDLIAFITSSPPATDATPDELAALRSKIAAEIDERGHFLVSKHTGSLICRRPRR